jgi:hypothetical protein
MFYLMHVMTAMRCDARWGRSVITLARDVRLWPLTDDAVDAGFLPPEKVDDLHRG